MAQERISMKVLVLVAQVIRAGSVGICLASLRFNGPLITSIRLRARNSAGFSASVAIVCGLITAGAWSQDRKALLPKPK